MGLSTSHNNQAAIVTNERQLILVFQNVLKSLENLGIFRIVHVLKESARFDQQRVEEALASLHFMHITVEPFSGAIVARAVQVAYEHAISLFAAGPVALGAHLRCQTVTCDDSIYRRVSSLPWTALLARLNL